MYLSIIPSFITLLLSCIVTRVTGEKILLFSGPMPSHFREINGVGVSLLDRKHDVHVLISNTIIKHVKDQRYQLFTYDDNGLGEMDEQNAKQMLNEFVHASSLVTKMQAMYENANSKMVPLCKHTVGNKELLEKLKKENYDLVIVDSLSLTLCFHLLPDYLHVPHVALGTEIRLSSTRITEPFFKFTSSDTLISRFFSYTFSILFENIHYIFVNYDALSEAAGYKYQNVGTMAEKSQLWLLNSDFLLQPPQSVPPHVRMVGGLSLQKFEALEESYQTFADSAQDGFLVLTFGSQMAYFPFEVAVKLAKVFDQIQPLKVVIRMKGSEVELFKNHKNVMIRSWLPQNDLLAHKNCKLFISHCGNNGQFEALYHAIPIIGFPLFGDQMNNAERIHKRGYGLRFGLTDFIPEDFANSIKQMSMDNSSYKLKITAASRVYRRQLPAQERAADAVEEVLRGESQFYYPEDNYKLSAWNYNHFDLFLLMFVGVQAIVLLSLCFVWLCCKYFCCRHKVGGGQLKYKTQ